MKYILSQKKAKHTIENYPPLHSVYFYENSLYFWCKICGTIRLIYSFVDHSKHVSNKFHNECKTLARDSQSERHPAPNIYLEIDNKSVCSEYGACVD